MSKKLTYPNVLTHEIIVNVTKAKLNAVYVFEGCNAFVT